MNILILAPLFPTPDVFQNRSEDPRTKFLFDYAMEWSRSENSVFILHLCPKYPLIFSMLVKMLKLFKFGSATRFDRFLQDPRTVRYANYKYEDLRIVRIPILKIIPHRNFFVFQLNSLLRKAKKELAQSNWVPDVVISDFLSPSLSLSINKGINNGAPVHQILHGSDLKYLHKHSREIGSDLAHIETILLRSYSMKKEMEQVWDPLPKYDYIFSGIPDDVELGLPRNAVRKFLYVGTLRRSKNVHFLIDAFSTKFRDTECTLTIVGSGPDEHHFKQLVNQNRIADQVHFSGRLDRRSVLEVMRGHDCLVMVSEETFGMVYIEAMSQGCIVVAAKDQGIDGIVIDGENGFLSPLNDQEALCSVLGDLSTLESDHVRSISEAAIRTAESMTDGELAEKALRSFL